MGNNDRYYNNGGSCTTAECDNAGSTEYYDISAVYTDNVCSVATCAKGTKPAADQLSCDSCATVSGRYYTTAGDCTITQNCPSLGDNEEYVTGVVLTSPTGCKKCSSPGIGQKFISPSPSPGACTVTPCPAVAGEYYIKAGDCTKMSSCTKRDSNQYYDKNETITRDDCSVATCPTDQTPAADGLSCEDETMSKVSETGDDAMIGTIVGSVIGALVLLAVVGIVVWVFVIRPRRRRDLGNRESKNDIELEAVTNNDEPVSRPSPTIESREKEL